MEKLLLPTHDTLVLIFQEEFGINEDLLSPGANLQTQIGVDSLQRVMLTVKVEETFGILISDSEILAVRYYSDLVELIEKRKAECLSL